MFPIAVIDAAQGHVLAVAVNLVVSAAIALGILHHYGELRRAPAAAKH